VRAICSRNGSLFGNYTPWQKKPRFPLAQDAISTTTSLDSVREALSDLTSAERALVLGGTAQQLYFERRARGGS